MLLCPTHVVLWCASGAGVYCCPVDLLGFTHGAVPRGPASHTEPSPARVHRGMAGSASGVGHLAGIPREAQWAAQGAGTYTALQRMLQVGNWQGPCGLLSNQ